MPLGLEDGRVDKAQMTSSSYNNVNDGPSNARLNSGRGWSPRRNDRTRFLQIDFQAMTKVTRVATQGKRYANSWVTKYYIKYGKTKSRFIPYRVGRKIKVGFLSLTGLCLLFQNSPMRTCKRHEKELPKWKSKEEPAISNPNQLEKVILKILSRIVQRAICKNP